MSVVAALKAGRRQMIAESPLTITIERRARVSSDGGFTENSSAVGPFTVRLYLTAARTAHGVQTLAGNAQVDPRYGLVADASVDLKAGPTVVDEFVADGRRYRILAVVPLRCAGEIYGYQAECEQVQ